MSFSIYKLSGHNKPIKELTDRDELKKAGHFLILNNNVIQTIMETVVAEPSNIDKIDWRLNNIEVPQIQAKHIPFEIQIIGIVEITDEQIFDSKRKRPKIKK